jgi:integrase
MVFSTGIGTPIEPDNLRRSWYRVRKVLGDPPPRLHDLRHTCVTLLLSEGAPPHVVQQIVGHSAHRRHDDDLCARLPGREAEGPEQARRGFVSGLLSQLLSTDLE